VICTALALRIREHLQSASPPVAPEGIRRVGDVLELRQHEARDQYGRAEEAGLGDVRDAAVNDHARIEEEWLILRSRFLGSGAVQDGRASLPATEDGDKVLLALHHDGDADVAEHGDDRRQDAVKGRRRRTTGWRAARRRRVTIRLAPPRLDRRQLADRAPDHCSRMTSVGVMMLPMIAEGRHWKDVAQRNRVDSEVPAQMVPSCQTTMPNRMIPMILKMISAVIRAIPLRIACHGNADTIELVTRGFLPGLT
jgi:hypothetical protein